METNLCHLHQAGNETPQRTAAAAGGGEDTQDGAIFFFLVHLHDCQVYRSYNGPDWCQGVKTFLIPLPGSPSRMCVCVCV